MGARPGGSAKSAGVPWLWALVLIIVGAVLLLDNFLLLGDFNAIALLPLVLVIIGAQILLRGDLITSTEARRFGITRGSVESGTLEVSSGAIDVELRALPRDLRLREDQYALIAGQFAANSRPQLQITHNHAVLNMSRSNTPLLAMADWKVGIAADLPWQIFISTYLGQVNVDLSEVIMHAGVIATGFGDIQIISPPEVFETLFIRSTLGTIHFITPPGYNCQIDVSGGRFFGVHVDEMRYENPEANMYFSKENDPDAPLVAVKISGTFGDVYLA